MASLAALTACDPVNPYQLRWPYHGETFHREGAPPFQNHRKLEDMVLRYGRSELAGHLELEARRLFPDAVRFHFHFSLEVRAAVWSQDVQHQVCVH